MLLENPMLGVFEIDKQQRVNEEQRPRDSKFSIAQENEAFKIFCVLAASNIWSFLLVVIPVAVHIGPENFYKPHRYYESAINL
jgi:hypothetical protein